MSYYPHLMPGDDYLLELTCQLHPSEQQEKQKQLGDVIAVPVKAIDGVEVLKCLQIKELTLTRFHPISEEWLLPLTKNPQPYRFEPKHEDPRPFSDLVNSLPSLANSGTLWAAWAPLEENKEEGVGIVFYFLNRSPEESTNTQQLLLGPIFDFKPVNPNGKYQWGPLVRYKEQGHVPMAIPQWLDSA